VTAVVVLVAVACLAVVVLSAAVGWRRASATLRCADDDRVRALVDVLSEAMAVEDDARAADALSARLAQVLDADAVALGAVRREFLVLLGSHGYPAPGPVALHRGQGLAGRAWDTGEAVLSGDLRHEPGYLSAVPGMRSGLYVPGRAGGAVAVVLCVESRRSARYDADDLRLLTPLADLVARLLEGRRAVRDATALEQRVVALVGHEIEGPLDRVLAALQGLRVSRLGAGRERLLREGSRAARELERATEALLLVARIEAGEMSVNPRPVDLSAALLSAVEAADSGPSSVVVRGPGVLHVLADPRHLLRALTELLPADAGPEQDYVVSASTAGGEVAVELPGATARGLPAVLARRLVELCGGRVEPGTGEVVIVLPAAQPGPELDLRQPAEAAADAR